MKRLLFLLLAASATAQPITLNSDLQRKTVPEPTIEWVPIK